ncbi:caprin-1-like isoform X2 [Paramormyrops kingsleyae]|uniref:caprin-1-like isoform X2 n=1 Tax=Paramormyrops kingsleyae TaxID=1676925 RepID=UPI000CD668F9|nr:caprin-1-like isoform X2 [Paramormyrops kingsleyae]
MPAATIGNSTVQSSSPEVGSGPGSVFSMSGQSSGAHTEAMKQVLCVIDKKVRNMEKKKSKLDDYQAKKNRGERLNQDQLDALSKFQEVANNVDFARELQKSLLALGQDMQKAIKKTARREQLLREEAEQKRLKSVLELQFLLESLGDETVRQDLKQGTDGLALLTDEDLTDLDNLYKLVQVERDPNSRLTDQFEEASVHLWELLEGRDKEVAGTTYKALKETLDRVMLSGYFDRAHAHHNGVCEELQHEEPPAAVVVAKVEAEVPPAEPEGEFTEEVTESNEVEGREFVNRQFIPESAYSSRDKEHGEEWNAESEGTVPPVQSDSLLQVSTVQQQQLPVQGGLPTAVSEAHTPNPVTSAPPADPVVRKQAVQDLMAQMQGPYNFMQDSMLEFDGQALDPAIVSAQPMKSTQNMDLPHLVCPPVHAESRLIQPSTSPVLQEPPQVPLVSSTSEAYSSVQPLYQSPHTTDPPPQTDASSPIQVFQPVSKPLHSSGINVNAAPFQSMQTVFNLNAPVPPGTEADTLKQPGQYPSAYSPGFGSQAPHPAEQAELQPEQLQSVIGAFHTQEQTIPAPGGHQSMSQQAPQQSAAFSRPGQSFYNSRPMSRGGPRNSRGMLNGFRAPSSGFRGGYDGFRPPFGNPPSSAYGQAQFNPPRDYSNNSYQRDGYQPNYKRGAGQGSRGTSRGNAQVMRS